MSKMTQRRMSRRATRKINVQARALRRSELQSDWLQRNLGAALSKLEITQSELNALQGGGKQ